MEIVFLGTSAAVPTAGRNTSAIAVIRDREILLFDCGEGTQMQFQKAGLRPGKLTRIFITHFHGDHLYGLIGFLTSLQLSGRTVPIELYGPTGLADYINYMKRMGSFDFNYPVAITEVTPDNPEVSWDCGDYTVLTGPLDHRVFTIGYRLEEKPHPGKFDVAKAEELGVSAGPDRARLQRGESVTISGGKLVRPHEVIGPDRSGRTMAICVDTKKTERALKLARGVDLLIHEATFDQSRKYLAETTQHATARDAAETALAAQAGRLLLTHISARFSENDLPMLLQEASAVFPDVEIANDMLRITI